LHSTPRKLSNPRRFPRSARLEAKPSPNPSVTMSLLVLVPARNTSAARRASSTLSESLLPKTTHFHLDIGFIFGEVQNRPASPDFDFFTMGAETK
jgi:hypothetical protein